MEKVDIDSFILNRLNEIQISPTFHSCCKRNLIDELLDIKIVISHNKSEEELTPELVPG